MIRRTFFIWLFLLAAAPVWGQRWEIVPNAGIVWAPGDDIPYADHIEMSGERMAFVLRWGVGGDAAFSEERSLVFPMLRTIPNDTHASLMYRMATDIPSLLGVNGLVLKDERVDSVRINGALTVWSSWAVGRNNVGAARKTAPQPVVSMVRTIFPSRRLPAMFERYLLRNISDKPIEVSVPEFVQAVTTDAAKGVDGSYVIRASLNRNGTFRLAPSDSLRFDAVFQALHAGEAPRTPDVAREYEQRMALAKYVMDENLVLETPDRFIDSEFRLAKLRASESVCNTKGGYMHAPGGESYYAAIWANDQAEYVNPFFPYLGYDIGNASALNAFRHFARFMNAEYRPLPSSIIAEGLDIWDGAGDRGDAAMIAYGAARYALARGSKAEADELWPLVAWCLEYCRRNLSPDGVVCSDTDELEGRFPAGNANLCTSALYYDALISAACLCREMGRDRLAAQYRSRARQLAGAVESFFGADICGYHTFRYYEENTLLRSWICMPLIVGIGSATRREGTVAALTGPELLTPDGLLTEQGSATFWDRSTLYALRGIFAAGYADRAASFLHDYSRRRLTGDHVPYPIEAWPEGSQRHLSAESGLYCRVITEGLFGIRPTGLHAFDLAPSMPSNWERIALRHIRAFDSDFDIVVERRKDRSLDVQVIVHGGRTWKGRIRENSAASVVIRK